MADDWQIFDDLSAKSPAFAGAVERHLAENPGGSFHEAVEAARAATFGADVVWPERWAVDGDRGELDEQIQRYAADHHCSYADAFHAIELADRLGEN